MSAKKHYDLLKDKGELLELAPYLTGEWEKDRLQFTRDYQDIENFLNAEDL